MATGHHYGNRQKCMKGTRCDLLQQFEGWSHDEQGERFLWLYGSAGTRKSAVAQTSADI